MTFLVPADHEQDPHVDGRSCGDPIPWKLHLEADHTFATFAILDADASEAAREKVLQDRSNCLHFERMPADLKRRNGGSSKEAREQKSQSQDINSMLLSRSLMSSYLSK